MNRWIPPPHFANGAPGHDRRIRPWELLLLSEQNAAQQNYLTEQQARRQEGATMTEKTEATLERWGRHEGNKSAWRLTWQSEGSSQQHILDHQPLKRPDWAWLIRELKPRGLVIADVDRFGGDSLRDRFELTLIKKPKPSGAPTTSPDTPPVEVVLRNVQTDGFRFSPSEGFRHLGYTSGPSGFSVTGRLNPAFDPKLFRLAFDDSSPSTEDRLIASARELVRTGEALKEATKAQKVAQDRHNRAQAKHREQTSSLAS